MTEHTQTNISWTMHILTTTVLQTFQQAQQSGMVPTKAPTSFRGTHTPFYEGGEVPADWHEIISTQGGVAIWPMLESVPYQTYNIRVLPHQEYIELIVKADVSSLRDFEKTLSQVSFEMVSIEGMFPEFYEDGSPLHRMLTSSRVTFTHHDQFPSCLVLQGDGHKRVVSRRWLERGPWLLRPGENDTSFIYLHDPSASVETAVEQLLTSYSAMDHKKAGGFLQRPYSFADPSAPEQWGRLMFDPNSLEFFLLVGSDINVPETMMVDLCAARMPIYKSYELEYAKRNGEVVYCHRPGDLSDDQEVKRLHMTFFYEKTAKRHLYALWLRGMECWFIDHKKAEKVRLDEDYTPPPPPQKPDWVDKLQMRIESGS